MDPLVHLAHTISPLAAGLLIASVWQGVLLTAAVAVALRTLQSLAPAVRTRIWTAVLLLVLLLPLLNLLVPSAATTQHAQIHVAMGWSLGLLFLWVVLALGRAVTLTANALRLWTLAAQATPVPVPASVLPLLAGPRSAILCTSAEINRPSVAGFLHPRILLPDGLLDNLSPAELEHVVLHEMEHLRRRDDWMNLLQQISLVLLPLNPALFWLDRRLCRERELACDDGVLAATQARKAYAACLVKLAEESLLRKGLTLALSALGTRARQSDLVSRVRRILAGPEPFTSPRNLRAATATLSLAAFTLAGLLARSPHWISFDAVPPATMAQATTPLQPQPPSPSFSANLVPASLTLHTAHPASPLLTSAVLEQIPAQSPEQRPAHRPAPATAFGRRKLHVRVLPAKTLAQSRNAWNPTPLQSTLGPSTTWSTLPVNAVAQNSATPQATPGQEVFPSARVVVTEFTISQPIYAAVPVRGGWLILQL